MMVKSSSSFARSKHSSNSSSKFIRKRQNINYCCINKSHHYYYHQLVKSFTTNSLCLNQNYCYYLYKIINNLINIISLSKCTSLFLLIIIIQLIIPSSDSLTLPSNTTVNTTFLPSQVNNFSQTTTTETSLFNKDNNSSDSNTTLIQNEFLEDNSRTTNPNSYDYDSFKNKIQNNYYLERLIGNNGGNYRSLESQTARIFGFRVEEVNKGVNYEHDGVSVVLSEKIAFIRLFGDRFSDHTIIRFVTQGGERGMDCDDVSATKSFHISKTYETEYSVIAEIELPPLTTGEEVFYLCARENNTDMPWVHQGTEPWLRFRSYKSLLPLWVQILIIIVLLMLSGLFSGLNLGLMSLDRTEMKIIANTGSPTERKYAKVIQPLRNKGNYLLCSLLLGNVMVNSTLTILLDDVSTGLIAIIVSTFSIVILGEIIPQAICSRHGLAVGAKTVYLTKFFMILTFPISYPISVLLDKALGEELGNVYNRDRLKELIKVTRGYNDLEKDEMNIISGALDLKQKTVKDIMTKLDEVFMLPVETILDFDTVSEIMQQGYSRIPVYEGSRQKVVSLLFTKDLALYDPADKMPLKRFCQFYNNQMMFVFETTTLDVLFKDFKQGDQGHMAFVKVINTKNEDVDPSYDVIGLVTLEDVIEELIQAEINDETDVYTYKNERSRSKVTGQYHRYPWNDANESYTVEVSPQLCLAAYQYLSTAVEEFGIERISKNILQRLLNQNFFFEIKIKRDSYDDHEKDDTNTIIYERGKPCDYFVLILEGRVQSEMGKENLIFESGPFTFFGVQALEPNPVDGTASPLLSKKITRKESVVCTAPDGTIKTTNIAIDTITGYTTFLPDYTVRAITDVTFLRISRSIYLAALQATKLERTYLDDTHAQKEVVVNFEEQIDKMRTSSHSFSNYATSIESDTESGMNEADETYDHYPKHNRTLGKSNSYQHLNGTPMIDKRKRKQGDALSQIILTPATLLNQNDMKDVTNETPTCLRDENNIDSPNNQNNNNNNLVITQNGHIPSNPSSGNDDNVNSNKNNKNSKKDKVGKVENINELDKSINHSKDGTNNDDVVDDFDDDDHCKL